MKERLNKVLDFIEKQEENSSKYEKQIPTFLLDVGIEGGTI
ncbi:hypothetical protein [Bacillus rhizoplanae]